MTIPSRFFLALRTIVRVLAKARDRMPAVRHGPRVADAQQARLVQGLCEQLRPQAREGADEDG